MSDYLTTDDLAEMVPHTSVETWQRLCRTKQIPAKKIGGGWTVRRVDFEAFMASEVPATARPARQMSARQMRRSA